MTATVTEIAQDRTTLWRSFFSDLAYDVVAGGQTQGVASLVAQRIAVGCDQPGHTFDRLVEAVRDLVAYTASREAEGEWLVAHRIVPDDEARCCYLEVIREQIAAALDELLRGVGA